MELGILDFISENLVFEPLTPLMKAITFLGNAGWFWILCGALMLCFKKTRGIGVAVCIALLCSLVICNLTLKPLIARTRPYDMASGIKLLIDKPNDFSFPSGHSSASFSAAVAIFSKNKKYGTAALMLASLIAYSRLYFYVHFPTDVLAGVAIGGICGLLGVLLQELIYRKFNLHSD